ncbi:hypothetical protein WJX74_009215 [Apatococcus lobatus]|uniref:Uncharacterized protein n=1 Tax=Apatococcus lobatus TaxID=904363 RepID=A0AAW1QHU1_9CHLO
MVNRSPAAVLVLTVDLTTDLRHRLSRPKRGAARKRLRGLTPRLVCRHELAKAWLSVLGSLEDAGIRQGAAI